jgi:hypothetical protein
MSATNDIFFTLPTGTFHWSVKYWASGVYANAPVYIYNGVRVIADVVHRHRRRTSVFLKTIDGAPQTFPVLTLTQLKTQCKPTGECLRDVVFGKESK